VCGFEANRMKTDKTETIMKTGVKFFIVIFYNFDWTYHFNMIIICEFLLADSLIMIYKKFLISKQNIKILWTVSCLKRRFLEAKPSMSAFVLYSYFGFY